MRGVGEWGPGDLVCLRVREMLLGSLPPRARRRFFEVLAPARPPLFQRVLLEVRPLLPGPLLPPTFVEAGDLRDALAADLVEPDLEDGR